ncbi:protein fluG-like [Vigna unguiculata]|uniref:protein fluG-like n=1 Tax=Vigna unguiculata TaxID=3917 RepID=UPI00101636A3|nr:protein fluG-like [Vigna unguiculata]
MHFSFSFQLPILFTISSLAILSNPRVTAIEDLNLVEREGMDLSELRKTVEEMEVVDGHSHNIVAFYSNSISSGFVQAFTVGASADPDAAAFAQTTLSFKRGLRDVAELYGTEVSLQSVEEYRKVSGIESITSTCLKTAKFSAILIDDGIEMDKRNEIQWLKNFTPLVGRILRTERVAEQILEQGLSNGSSWTIDSFTEAYVSKLRSVAKEIYALKSIVAYYGGLEINLKVTKTEAEESLRQVLINATKPIYLLFHRNLVDYLFLQSLEIALSYDLPMQIHTGFGDRLLDLRKSNPLHFRSVLEDKRYSKCRFVFLHASHPFSKEASYLASVYSQVYLDFGLAIPKLSMHGMISAVKDLLTLAPINKVMFSTDAYTFPETFYLGAKNSREVVFSVLRDACNDGELLISEAVEAAKDILARNAIRFYKINSTNITVP